MRRSLVHAAKNAAQRRHRVRSFSRMIDHLDFEAFAQQALYSEVNVKSFTTFVCLERVKVSTTAPIA